MASPRFVCYGVEGEYVLAPLASELRARGLAVAECIAQVGCDAAAQIDALAARPAPTVLVTCAHAVHDAVSMRHYLGIPGAPSPMEVQAALRPVCTVYLPHDLSGPLRWDELGWLRQVDLYLGATPAERMFRRWTSVEIVGWARLQAPPWPVPRRGRALWLFSDAESLVQRDGVAAVVARLRPFLRPWCALKFAPYSANDALAQALREIGTDVLSSTERPTAAAAGFDLVITNGESSVVRETAGLGKPVFIVTDGALFPASQLGRLWQFADLPTVHCVPSLDAIPAQVCDGAASLQPFDAVAAVQAILRRLPDAGR